MSYLPTYQFGNGRSIPYILEVRSKTRDAVRITENICTSNTFFMNREELDIHFKKLTIKLEKNQSSVCKRKKKELEITSVGNSTRIDMLAYDRINNILYVSFIKGGTYAYSEVPQKVAQELMEADSIGRAFQELILNKYKHAKLENWPFRRGQ